MELFGLPDQVTAAINSSNVADDFQAFSTFPSAQLNITGFGPLSTIVSINVTAGSLAPPSFGDVFVEVFCADEFAETFFFFDVVSGTDFFTFFDVFFGVGGGGGIGFAGSFFDPYSGADVSLNPSSLKLSSNDVGGEVIVSTSGLVQGEVGTIELFGWDLPGGFLDYTTGQGATVSGNPWKKTIKLNSSAVIPPGFYEVEVSDQSGNFGSASLQILPSDATFDFKTSKSWLGPVQQGETSEVISITAQSLSTQGLGAGTVNVNLFGIPPGVTALFDIGDGNGFVATTSVSLNVGTGIAQSFLKYQVDDDAPLGPVLGDLFATSSTTNQEFWIFADFDVVPTDDYFNFVSFCLFDCFEFFFDGFLTVTPFSALPGEQIVLTAIGFPGTFPVDTITMGFNIKGEPLPITLFPGVNDQFDANNIFSFDFDVPPICTADQVAAQSTVCLPGPGFYPITLNDTAANIAVTEFEVLPPGTNIKLQAANNLIFLEQGQSQGDDSPLEVSIKQQTSNTAEDPGIIEVSMFGVPEFITVFVNTTSGGSFTTPTTESLLNFTIPDSGNRVIQLDFQVDNFAPPIFTTIFIEADPANGAPIELPIDIIIEPQEAVSALFDTGAVYIDPAIGKENDTVTLTLIDFTNDDTPVIDFGGVFLSAAIGNLDATKFAFKTSPFGSEGYTQIPMRVPDDDLMPEGVYFISVSDAAGPVTGSTIFEKISGNQTFNMVVDDYIDPVIQGQPSDPILVDIEPRIGKIPGNVTISLFGLPPDSTSTFTDLNDVVTAGTKTTLSVGVAAVGKTNSTFLNITPAFSTPPGVYFISLVSNSSDGSTDFYEIFLPVEPAGLDLVNDVFGSVFMNPPLGQPTNSTTLQGFGFTPGGTPVITFGTTDIAIPAPGGTPLKFGALGDNDQGEYSQKIDVPSLSPGFYPVTLSDGVVDDTFFFEILPEGAPFSIKTSDTYLDPVKQGDNTETITITAKVQPTNPAIDVILDFDALLPGMTPEFDLQQNGDFDDGATITLKVTKGGSNRTDIRFATTASTPPGFFNLFLGAANASNTLTNQPYFTSLAIQVGVSSDIGGGKSAPTLSLFPSPAQPSQSISISGLGFDDGTFTTAQLTLPGSPTTLNPVVNASNPAIVRNNQFDTEFKVPSTAPSGKYSVSITSGTTTADAELTVIQVKETFFELLIPPKIVSVDAGVVDPANSLGTTTFNIESSNLDAGLTLGVSALPPGVNLHMNNVTLNGIAKFSATLTGVTPNQTALLTKNVLNSGVPTLINVILTAAAEVALGQYTIFITAVDSAGNLISEPLLFEVIGSATDPSATINPKSGDVGTTPSIIGEDFTAGETIRVIFGNLKDGEQGFTTIPSPLVVDASGDFNKELVVPDLPAKTYQVNFTGVTSGSSVIAPFQVLPAALNTFEVKVSPKTAILTSNGMYEMKITLTGIGIFNEVVNLDTSGLPGTIGTMFSNSAPKLAANFDKTVTLTLTDTAGVLNEGNFDIIATSGGKTTNLGAGFKVIPNNDFTFSLGPDEIILQEGGDSKTINTQLLGQGTPGNQAIAVAGKAIDDGHITFPAIPDHVFNALNIAKGTIVLTAPDVGDANLGTHQLTVEPGGNAAKAVTIDITIVKATPEIICVGSFVPSTYSEIGPWSITPNFTTNLAFDPVVEFDSLTTNNEEPAQICPSFIVIDDMDDFGPLPGGFLGFPNTNVITADVEAGTTELDARICMPIPADVVGEVDPVLFFFNQTKGEWVFVVGTIVVDEEPDGTIDRQICTIDVDHTSSWAVGGVKALALGAAGGGGGAPTVSLSQIIAAKIIDVPDHIIALVELHDPLIPIKALEDDGTFDFPLSMDGKGYVIASFSNTLETHTIQAGEPTTLKNVFYDYDKIEHISMYLNLRDAKDSIRHSDTQIIWNAGEPLKIIDPNGFFESVNVIVIEDEVGLKKEAIFEIVFAKGMETTDMILRQWDENLSSRDTIIKDALMILPPPPEEENQAEEDAKKISEPGEGGIEVSELKIEYSTDIPDWIQTNAKWWNEGHITDTDFARGIKFLIENKILDIPSTVSLEQAQAQEIPGWFKNSVGWWGDGLLPDKHFINQVKWLIENGIIVIQK